MTKAKKVVALMLAFMMIFSSVSVLASAWSVNTDDGSTLEIGTKFFKEVNGEWVETTKVRPRDVVKARVYLGTDYYSNDSTLLFFYDKVFFTHAYGTLNSLEVNGEAGSFAAVNKVSGSFSATPNLNSMVSNGYIDSAFLDDYGAFLVNVKLGVENNVMYDNSTWLFEFTLTVSDAASGSGDLFVKDTTIQNTTTQTKGKVNVPKGPADGTAADAYAMWLWDATPVLSSQPVSTESSVTFNANTGVFADGTDTYFVEGKIGSDIVIPAISKEGYTFLGWTDELGNEVSTPTTIPEDDLVLNAKWIKNVNITFDTDGGSEITEITNVTPNTEFAKPANPTKAGYTFVGWDVRDGQLPDVYPETDTTYTAIWALDVTVSFDTLGGTEIAPMNGYAGESFDKDAVPAPTKEGHTFINWSPALPDVYPDQSTTYTAVYETKTYPVRYFVNGKEVASSSVEFGSMIPTDIPVFDVPEGQQLSGWYTDESLATPLPADATVSFDLLVKFGDGEDDYQIVLYATTSDKYFDAVFDANGGAFSDGSDTKTVSTVYGTGINVPENPTRDHYEFLGWEPDSMIMDSEGKTFKAIWGVPTYTVEYYSDGAKVDSFTIEVGQPIERIVNPYKTGHKFIGWTDVKDSTTLVTIPDVMPESNLTYYAVFEVRQYTITFADTGDTVIPAITQDYGTDVTAPEDPTKTGYTFTGWADKNGNKVDVPATMPAKNTTLTAQWQINKYTITFADTGDTVIPAITQDYGTDVTAPSNPTKTGYTFAGWDTEIPETMPAGDMTITATWTVNQYTITFDTDGGTEVAPITQDYNTTVSAPTAPIKTGYTFAGWDNLPATMPADNVTVKAKWTVNQYTITFDTDGGTEVAPITQDYGTAVSEPTAPTKIGYTFTGWDNLPATMPADNVTVKAKWTINQYTITFNTDGGTEVAPITQDYGTEITKPADPKKEGYTFDGWYVDDNKVDVPATMPAENVTLTAKWNINSYTVTWDVDGVTNVETYAYGATINAPENPTKTGYSFAGWTPSVDATMPAENVTYTATWTANIYDATFNAGEGTFENGSSTMTVPTAYDSAIVPPEEPTRAGYTFGGWTPAVGNMDAEGKTFEATWIANTNTMYTVETYTMNTAGTYDMTSQVFAGETDSEVTATYTVNEGFALNAEKSVLTGTVAADNSLVLKVYIDRISYTLTTDVDGVTTGTTYLYGATVKVDDPDKIGYGFAGWVDENGDPTDIPATMPAKDVTVTATWTANEDTEFTVVINYTDVTTGQAATEEKYFYGTTGYAIAIVNEIPADQAENTVYVLVSELDLAHYELDTSAANELTGTIAADGSTVLNVYYVPVKVTATFNAGAGSFADSSKEAKVTVDYYSTVAKPADDPTREGYTFGGWNNWSESVRLYSDRTFDAIWNINQYTITFADTGDSTITAITQDYGTAVIAPANPTKTGYTFAGWDTEIPATMPAGDMTITAKWTINQYTITFNTDGGTEVAPITQDYGTAITAPSNPTKTGYTFLSWSEAVPATMPAENKTLTAQWKINQYTITFDSDGGTEVAPITQDYNTAVSAPTAPTKTGYTFAGWSPALPTTMPAENVTVKAQWTVNSYTVTWDVDGVTNEETYEYGATINAPENPTKTGYSFAGWTPTVDATMPARDVTYSATWAAKTYNAVFDANGGYFDGDTSVTSKTVPTAFNDAIEVPAAPERPGYEFNGWDPTPATMNDVNGLRFTAKWIANTDTTYTVETYTMGTDGNYVKTSEKKTGTTDEIVNVKPATVADGFALNDEKSVYEGTVLADNSLVLKVYLDRKSYTLTINVDGTKTPVTYLYGAAVAAPAEPSKAGYTFTGWSPAVPATMPAKDLTVTAQWNINQYTITFNTDGGSNVAPITQNYGTAITAPANPTKAGYVFAGWLPEIPATMPAGNMTVTAQWNAATDTKYTVETYTMNAEGAYEMTSQILEGTTESTVTAQYVVNDGFALNSEESVLSGTVQADGTLVLKVYLDRKSYTLTTDVDGTVTTVTYRYGEDVVAISDPTKTGFDFAGWVDENNDKVEVPSTMPAKNVNLTATWNVLSFTITYRYRGTILKTVSYNYGDTIADYTPSLDGYTFSGWSPELPETMPASDINTQAQFVANTDTDYTVETYTMDLNGEYGTPVIETLTGTTDQTVTYTAPEIEGFTVDDENSIVEGKIAGDGTLVLRVYYIRDQFTLTTNVDGVSTSVTYYYDADVAEPATPTKTGYTFAGWVDAVTNQSVTIPAKMPAEDMNLKATWTANQYTITFNTDGGSAIEAITQDYGTAITKPANPTKTGYTFGGWDKEIPATMPAGDMTITAKWTINQYTITFNTDGGTEVAPITQDYGTDVTAPSEPTKEGYTFGGWYVDDNKVDVPATMPAENVTLTAKWNINSYTVTWDVDGVTNVETYAYGATINAPADPEKTGYSFAGWTPSVDATMPATDVTYTATWTANVYDATFNAGEGTFADGSSTMTVPTAYDSAIAVPTAPTRPGYTFGGWSPAVGNMDDVKGKTFTATWIANTNTMYTVETNTMKTDGTYDTVTQVFAGATDSEVTATYTVNEGFALNAEKSVLTGTVLADNSLVLKVYLDRQSYTFKTIVGEDETSTTYLYGATIATPAEPAKEGYTFTGWSPAVPATMPAENLTVTAQWTINQYTITFADTGDSTIPAITQDYGTEITAPSNPTKTGYTFNGWDTVIPATMPAGDMTITAQWTINKHTVTFYKDWAMTIVIKSETLDYGTAIVYPDDPSVPGQDFIGWSEELDTVPDREVNIYADYTPIEYDYFFYNEDGTSYDDGAYDAFGNYNDEIEAPDVEPTKEGYTFDGWFIDGAKATFPVVIDSATYRVYEFTAQFTINQYTLTFADTGDSVIDPITQDYGTEITKPENPTRVGYTFNGWSEEIPATMPAESKTITAQWTANTYDAVFMVDGSVYETVPTAYDAQIVAPAEPTKAGYEFIKWTPEVGIMDDVNGKTFTAVFEANAYSVEYVVNGKSVGNYSLETGAVIPTTVTSYTTPVGYEFDGWYTDEGMTIKLAEGATVADSNITLYASETAKVYDAVFDANGGVFADGSDSKTVPTAFDAEIVLPGEPTMEGYTFAGWDPEPATMDAEGKTFTAIWDDTTTYTVTYYVEGAEPEVFEIEAGKMIEHPVAPYKEGYTFVGWFDADGKNLSDYATMPAKDLEFTASFSQNFFTVTYMTYALDENGRPTDVTSDFTGFENNTQTYAVGATIDTSTMTAPEIQYYTFEGWFYEDGTQFADGTTMGSADLVLYAKYQRVPVKLVPIEGSTTMIERNGVIESYNDGYTVTNDEYVTPANFEQYYIYGFTNKRALPTEANLTTRYVTYTGDGRIEIERVSGMESAPKLGTGTKVKLYDEVTGELVEEFYLIYFGDVDGDCYVTSSDYNNVYNEVNVGRTWSSIRGTKRVPYLIKAANLDGTANIYVSDMYILYDAVSATLSINQITGLSS